VIVRAPGRINLIGEHTDYNLGLSLPAAIDKAFHFLIGPAAQATIHAHDLSEQWLVAEEVPADRGWARYFAAMHQLLADRGLSLPSLACVFGGDIPVGGGLSSSAALCCGYLFALNQWQNWGLSRRDIANLAQAAEHRVGIQCGLLDQLAVLFGQPDQAVMIDFADLTLQPFALDLGEYTFMLLDTKVKHSLVDSAYNQRRADCEAVLARVQVDHPEIRAVSHISQALLDQYRPQLAGKQYQRVQFVLNENQRVRNAAAACSRGKLSDFGQCLYQSHEGLKHAYEVSCDELDLLVDLAQQEPAVLGARMMGGGFGGCTLNLVHRTHMHASAERMLAAYDEQTGLSGEVYFVAISDGVNRVGEF
jgi:galactokinase